MSKEKTSGSTRLIATTTDDSGKQDFDPWIRTLLEGSEGEKSKGSRQRGPVYKVDVEVKGVWTRALLDHGAQVSLLRLQMLPMIKDKKQWSLEQCHSKNRALDQQPVGAEGNALGAVAVLQLQVRVYSTGIEQDVPFYVLDSTKPIWTCELTNCGVILGTNALSSLGFQISLPDGSTLEPESTTPTLHIEAGMDTVDEPKKNFAKQQAGTPGNSVIEESEPI